MQKKQHPDSEKFGNGLTRFFLDLRNRYFILIDLLAFCVTALLAMWMRTESLEFILRYASALALYILIATVLRWAVFVPYGLYSRYWRYASVDELWQITLCVAVSTVLVALAFFGVMRPFGWLPDDFPRSLPFMDGVLILVTVGGLRYSVRFIERIRQRTSAAGTAKPTRVVIFGAGDAGAMIVKEMRSNPQRSLEPVAFLDDDWRKYGARIHGVPIVGGRQKIADLMSVYAVQQAIIAMPTASGKTIRELTQLCRDAHLPVRTVPGVFELLDGSVTVNQLRPVEITDLLRREPVQSDIAPVLQLLKGKRVLVTGAGGSIGSELCRQIARCDPGVLILLGHGENSIFDASNEFYSAYPQLMIRTVVADIRDSERMGNVFARQRPDIVFHTAAHKHVPLMEDNVEDAVSNNVIGTRNILTAAAQHGVNYFVLISTDKAVNPSSVMGTTKRIAELLVQETAKQTGRNFVVVRFGNVLGSRGSVVPTFKKQIAQGGPITVTHPKVCRYFMTISEAIQLVLQATTLGKGGEIFFLEMGEPVKIVDLARDLIRLSGLEEGQDVDIVFTGLRPGEKLFEELTLSADEYGKTAHDKIYVNRNGDSNHRADGVDLQSQVDALVAACRSGDKAQVRRMLCAIVPEYCPAESIVEPTSQIAHPAKMSSARVSVQPVKRSAEG